MEEVFVGEVFLQAAVATDWYIKLSQTCSRALPCIPRDVAVMEKARAKKRALHPHCSSPLLTLSAVWAI